MKLALHRATRRIITHLPDKRRDRNFRSIYMDLKIGSDCQQYNWTKPPEPRYSRVIYALYPDAMDGDVVE